MQYQRPVPFKEAHLYGNIALSKGDPPAIDVSVREELVGSRLFQGSGTGDDSYRRLKLQVNSGKLTYGK